MAAVNFLRVQPDILLLRQLAGEKIVLPVVAPDENLKPVGRAEDHGFRRRKLHLLFLPRLAQITALRQFLPDVLHVALGLHTR